MLQSGLLLSGILR